jgi:hypothetical protein
MVSDYEKEEAKQMFQVLLALESAAVLWDSWDTTDCDVCPVRCAIHDKEESKTLYVSSLNCL